MKKAAKTNKKTGLQKKTSASTRKKTAKAVKTPRKRRKKGASDIKLAFILAAALIVLSVCISIAVVCLRSNNEIEQPPFSVIDEPIESPASPVHIEKPEVVINVERPVQQPVQPPPPVPSRTTAPAATPAQRPPYRPPERPVERPVENLGALVFVIDDAGNNLRELEPFLQIPGPLTIAVLPGLPHSAEAARRIRAAGKEVFLHQPMEAIGAQNPGPGAIYSGMSREEIRAILARNIAEVGPVTGINNHQGSRITMDREAVETILAFCAEHSLYFLDSRTTAESVVPSVAQQMGIQIAERNVFIDNEQNRDSMIHFISNGLARAQRTGSAVMIGHTWSPELAPLLKEKFPLLIKEGYTIKTASDIIRTR